MISTQPTTTKQRGTKQDGFTMHPNWLFDSQLSLMARYVYLVLLSYLPYGANTGVVWPAVTKIGATAKISPRAAYKALYELRGAGLITMRKRPEDANHNEYVIHALSLAQIEALCRPASPLLPADMRLHEVQTQTGEVAPGADPRLHHVQPEVAPRAHEVEQGTRTRERDQSGLAGQAASGGSPLRGNRVVAQGLGEVGDTTGAGGSLAGPGFAGGLSDRPGCTAGSLAATAGPGFADGLRLAAVTPPDTTGSLAGTPGLAGSTAGSGAGQRNDFRTANSENHWNSRVSTHSKGERYKRPLDETETEFQVSLVTVFAIEQMGIPAHKRGANLTSARYMLDDDKRDPAEVRTVIRRVVANSSRWCHVTNLFMVRKEYAEILADANSGTAPKKVKPKRRATSDSSDAQKPTGAAPVPTLGKITDLDKPSDYDPEEERRKDREMEADPAYQRIYEQKRAEHPNCEEDFLKLLARCQWREQQPGYKPSGTVRILKI
jgi:hypothetical protein